MLEAKLEQAELLKKILDAVKELVTDANFDCSDEGIKLQAMDNSHVALVSLNLAKSGFSEYRCDRDMSLGVSLASLQKIVKCAGNNDILTLRADESVDVLALLFEAKRAERVGEYEMKLMDIDQEHLGIPDTVYDAEIDLPATEFARIIRDLKELGESVKIEVSKEGVRFSADGDIGTASVTLKPTDKRGRREDTDDEEDSDEEQQEDDEEDEEAEEPEPKEEDEDAEIADVKPKISGSDDEDEDDAPAKPKKRKVIADSDEEDAAEDDGDAAHSPKKVKKENGKAKAVKKEKKKPAPKKGKASSSTSKAKAAKGKKAKGGEEEKGMDVRINLQQAVALTFSIKYLSNFAKSTPLAERVHLHMSNEVPLLVEYAFEQGHIRYYLAPKLTDE